jgi:hypothetical protein
MTLALGLFALAGPVLLLTDPIRQRDVADRLAQRTVQRPAARR